MMVRRTTIVVICYVGPLSEICCDPRPRRKTSMIVLMYYVGHLCEFQIG